MTATSLTEAMIRRCASVEAFRQGRESYQQGAVLSLIKRGAALQAEVKEQEPPLCHVRCLSNTDTTFTASCTCSYLSGGWCKHIVAMGLMAVHQPEQIVERPPLDTLLADLNREQLHALIVKLAEHDTSLITVIEGLAQRRDAHEAAKAISTAKSSARPSLQIDPKAIRHQVRSILHSLDRMRASEAYWYVGGIVNEIRQLLKEKAWTLIEADEGRAALSVLETITEAYLEEWVHLDDSDGEASGFFSDLGPAWTEALLSADLSSREREGWIKQLDAWQQEIDAYGIDPIFDAAQDAAARGWDYPPLLRVFQGEITEQGAWENEAPDYAAELAIARLHVLERRRQWQEYLYLAEAEGQTEAYVTMLVRLGRGQEAVDYGLQYFGTTQEALTLAQALYEYGEREDGLHIAERGLTLQGSKLILAKWLRDEAAVIGNLSLALSAATVAFRGQVDLPNYLRIAELAGDQWTTLHPELLEIARHTSAFSEGRIDVFLHEHLIDDAIVVVDAGAYYTQVAKVVDAALLSHPDWAIQACKKQAEDIMNRGKSELYSAAANWLGKAHLASHHANRDAEWRDYLAELLSTHARKYKLVPLLKALQ